MSKGQDRFRELVRGVASRQRTVIERPDLTAAAVLVPIVFRNGGPNLILTKRTMTVASHKGQISFPGGAREPQDADAVDTALRESNEEIGLDPRMVEVVGALDDFTTTTNFVVTPVVGFVTEDAAFAADPVEVAELFEVPVEALMDDSVHELVSVEHEGRTYTYHNFEVGDHVIWGATGGIIHRFLKSLKEEEAR